MSDGTTIYEIALSQQDYDNALGVYNTAHDYLSKFLDGINEEHNLIALGVAFRDYAGGSKEQLRRLSDVGMVRQFKYRSVAIAFDQIWNKHARLLIERYEGKPHYPAGAPVIVTFKSPDERSFTFHLGYTDYFAEEYVPLAKVDRDTFRAALGDLSWAN